MSRFFVYCEGVVYFTETIDDNLFDINSIQSAFATIYNAKTLEIATPFTVTISSTNFQGSNYIAVVFNKPAAFVYSIGLTNSVTTNYFDKSVLGTGVEYSSNYFNVDLLFLDYIVDNYDKSKYILNKKYNVYDSTKQSYNVYNPVFICAKLEFDEYTWLYNGSSINSEIDNGSGTNATNGIYAISFSRGIYTKTNGNTIDFILNNINYSSTLCNSAVRSDQLADILTAAMNLAIKDIIYSENTSILVINTGAYYYTGVINNTNNYTFDITAINATNNVFLNKFSETKQIVNDCVSFYFGQLITNIFLGDSNHNVVYTEGITPTTITDKLNWGTAVPTALIGV